MLRTTLLLLASIQPFVGAVTCGDDDGQSACSALGCGGVETRVVEGTTLYEQVVTGTQRWPTPDGATLAGVDITDGITIATFAASKPTTILLPTSPPKGPGGKPDGGQWVITNSVVTHVAGPGNTLIFTTHVLSSIKPTSLDCPSVAPFTVTSTDYVTLPPVTTTEVSVIDHISTTTSIIVLTHPVTTTLTETSISVLPPSTTTENLRFDHTSTTTSVVVLTESVTTTVTETSVSVQPPITTTQISVVDHTSISTVVVTQPVTMTVTETSISQLPAVTSTTTVSYCPRPSPPACAPGVYKPWTNVDIYVDQPYSFQTDDYYPTVMSFQDASYRTEQWIIEVDGQQIGVSSPIGYDKGLWCGLGLAAIRTCDANGHSKGIFQIPAGKRIVTIRNVPGIFHDTLTPRLSTVFYVLERSCPGIPLNQPTVCSESSVQPWNAVDITQGVDFTLTFDYNFDVKMDLVDAGYILEKSTTRSALHMTSLQGRTPGVVSPQIGSRSALQLGPVLAFLSFLPDITSSRFVWKGTKSCRPTLLSYTDWTNIVDGPYKGMWKCCPLPITSIFHMYSLLA